MPAQAGAHRQHARFCAAAVRPNSCPLQRRRGGAERASGHFDTKREAIDRGREISRNAGTEFKIHNQDGRIGQSDSHGNDPRNIKG